MIKRKITKSGFDYNYIYTISIFGFVVYCCFIGSTTKEAMIKIFGNKLMSKV